MPVWPWPSTVMNPQRVPSILILLLLAVTAGPAWTQGFSFSQQEAQDKAAAKADDDARQNRIADQLATPCRTDLKGKKIMLVVGQVQSNGVIMAHQQNYGPIFQAINSRLRSLGLKTFTPEEIRAQIAQAEIDAYFRNDPDAALAASKKLGASFVLKGLINEQAMRNPMMPVNQVSVNMTFTLTGGSGRIISNADAYSTSYAGVDVSRMAQTLVNENADEVVAKLYGDYCRNAGLTASKAKN
jgi:acid stress-induced BolA-like protein IbaG/YrbA